MLAIREIFIKNFNVTIKSLEYKSIKFYNNNVLYFLSFFPFSFITLICYLINIKYIYKLDKIYFSNYNNNFRILPFIDTIYIYNNNENKKLISINKYNYSIPWWFIIEKENLNEYENIEFKYKSKGKLEERKYKINDLENKLLYEIF
jgi:hypothetical protein